MTAWVSDTQWMCNAGLMRKTLPALLEAAIAEEAKGAA